MEQQIDRVAPLPIGLLYQICTNLVQSWYNVKNNPQP